MTEFAVVNEASEVTEIAADLFALGGFPKYSFLEIFGVLSHFVKLNNQKSNSL